MSEWKETKLKDAGCKFLSGYAFKSEDYSKTGIPLIKIGNIQNNAVLIDENGTFIEAELITDKLSKYLLCNEDILIAMTGQGSVGRVGKLQLADKQKALLNQRVGKFITTNSEINIKYLYYVLASPTYQEYLFNTGSGSGQPNLSPELILETEVILPPLPEQERIAEVLSSLDDKIDLLQRQNKTLEAMAETLFRQWFESEESGPDTPLSEFLDFLEGPGLRHWQYTLSGVRFINIRLIDKGELHVETANFVAEEEAHGRYKHFLLQEKDMVVSTSGTLGKSAIVRKYHLPLMLNTSVIRFRPTDGISYSFMYQYLQSKAFLDHLETTASGSVQANFGPSHLKMMTVSFPTKEKIRVFSFRLDPLYEKINHNYSQINHLETLRDTLLPKLISGEVRVSA